MAMTRAPGRAVLSVAIATAATGAALALGLGLVRAPLAHADDGPGDGLYGRFDGDWSLHAGLGGGVASVQGRARGTMLGELRLRYLDAAGPFVSARWGPEASEHLVLGAEVRPLFPALFLQNAFSGHEFADLLLQSIGIELGAALAPLDDRIGVGLAVGGGVEVPLVLPSRWGDGVWLRVGGRWIHTEPSHQAGPDVEHDEWTVYATLAVKGVFGGAVAGWEPPRWRR